MNRLSGLISLTTLFALAFFMPFATYSQEVIKVEGARGIAEIVGRISEQEARQEALNEAKVEALRKAGVSEHLQSYATLFRSEVESDFSQFFNSDIHTELRGAIQKYEVVKQERLIDPQTNLFTFVVEIDATVILYETEPDPTFIVRVDGVKTVYEEGENLEFTVFATQSCYLHIFNISDLYASQIFPNMWEPFTKIHANSKVSFPFKEIIDYTLYKIEGRAEMNRMVLVFTKEPIQFLGHSGAEDQITSNEAIFSWIYSITPDKRVVDYQTFTIR